MNIFDIKRHYLCDTVLIAFSFLLVAGNEKVSFLFILTYFPSLVILKPIYNNQKGRDYYGTDNRQF